MSVLLAVEHHWECPNCDVQAVTHDEALPLHACAKFNGLTAPLVPAGTRCKVEAKEREDYLGSDTAQTDDEGHVYMSVVTTRDDGQDCVVLAPTATSHWSDR